MSDAAIVAVIIAAALVLFIWNRLPAALVAAGVPLALFFTGILTAPQALAGFGDPVVILLAALFIIAAGLEAAGVTTWAGQKLIDAAGGAERKAMLLLMAIIGVFCAMIGFNATVAALLPVVIVLAIRLKTETSQLMLPLAYAAHSASVLTLLGTPINVIALGAAQGVGLSIGFFEFAAAGLPLFLGSVLIIMLTYKLLLPRRNGDSLPPDFSAHAVTLVEQYRLEDGLHRLRVRSTSPLIGIARSEIGMERYPEVSLVAIENDCGEQLVTGEVGHNNVVLVRGAAGAVARFAADLELAPCEKEEPRDVQTMLFNKESGLAEVVIPPRSQYIGETVFNGMATPSGDLLILSVQRQGAEIGNAPVVLAPGDTLLLQGTWQALDKRLASPQVLVVDSPDLVRRQAVPLSWKAQQAIGVMGLLIVLLLAGVFPPAISAMVCAGLMILSGVINLPAAYRGIDWNTCILVGAMIPIAPAMANSGVDLMIGGALVDSVGEMGPIAILAGLFIVTGALTQVMANTAAALVMMPIAIAASAQVDIAPLAPIIVVAIAAQAALLTPVGTPPNLMVMGPGGYRFGDYAKFGVPLLLWWFVVAMVFPPLYWGF